MAIARLHQISRRACSPRLVESENWRQDAASRELKNAAWHLEGPARHPVEISIDCFYDPERTASRRRIHRGECRQRARLGETEDSSEIVCSARDRGPIEIPIGREDQIVWKGAGRE